MQRILNTGRGMHAPAGAGTRARAADRRRLRADGERADVDLRRHEHHQRRARGTADPRRVHHLEDLEPHRDRPDPVLGVMTPVMFGIGWLLYKGVLSRISNSSPGISVL